MRPIVWLGACLASMACWIPSPAWAQAHAYANFANGTGAQPGNLVTGTGSWLQPTTVPNFSYRLEAPGNDIESVTYGLSGDEMPETNAWETRFGRINAFTRALIVRHAGNASSVGQPLGNAVTTRIQFQADTASAGWGFLVLDIDADQVQIVAKDGQGNTYSSADIDRWYRGSFDADTDNGTHLPRAPCWDASTSTVVGSEYVSTPCTRVTTLGGQAESTGAGAWFQPDQPVRELEFIFHDLQATATPSQRYLIAAAVRPTAVPDAFAIPLSGVLQGSVATNDSNGFPTQYRVVTPPTVGTLALQADGSFEYTPAGTGAANTEFFYEVCQLPPDEVACSASTRVRLTRAMPPATSIPTGTPEGLALLSLLVAALAWRQQRRQRRQ